MGPALALLFLVVPILEIYVIIQVGQVIGALPTVLLLVAESALGAWLVRREGRRTWRTLQEALRSGRPPGRELTDGALMLVGATLLLTPGFLTDVAGFFLVLPFTRPIARRMLTAALSRRFVTFGLLRAASRGAGGTGGATRASYGPRRRPPVVPGEVVPDDPSRQDPD